MSSNQLFQLEQNESYALIEWNSNLLIQENYEELENLVRLLFKKEYSNIIINMSKVDTLDGYGVSAIRKGTKICINENGLFVVVNKKDEIIERLDAANIKSYEGSGTAFKDLTSNLSDFTLVGAPSFNSNGFFIMIK